jgi:hypothetical protein
VSTRVSTTIHVHRELLSQLDLILAERTEAARSATGTGSDREAGQAQDALDVVRLITSR